MAEPVELLVFIRLKGRPHGPQPAADVPVVPVSRGESHLRLFPDDRPVPDEIGHTAPFLEPDLQISGLQPHVLPVPPNLRRRFPGQQGPVLQFDLRGGCRLEADAAFRRYADNAGLARPRKENPVSVNDEFHLVSSVPGFPVLSILLKILPEDRANRRGDHLHADLFRSKIPQFLDL